MSEDYIGQTEKEGKETKDMKILVVGGGGREHAIVHAISKSPRVKELYCAPGNGGISNMATCVPIGATEIDKMVAFAVEQKMDLVMVAPDDPLALGLVDALEEAGIPAFGPRKNAAILESSKAFSKKLMQKCDIPTAKYNVCTDIQSANDYIEAQGAPIVVKADGLALGKGVTVAATVEEAKAAVVALMEEKCFGTSGSTVVIEECLEGPEVTVLCFTDGKTVLPMLPSRDHKRAFDDNKGPNTGGMGAYCPCPEYTPEVADYCMQHIFQKTVDAMAAEDRLFQGVLYFGLMLTKDGPKVIEYNARFGDPETQPLLSMLQTDIVDIFDAVINCRLDEIELSWKQGAACCVVMASGGYPGEYHVGYPISGLDQLPEDVTVYHAGTRNEGGNLVTAGGRVLGVTACGTCLEDAVSRAYAGVARLSFTDAHYRKDIGR